MSKKLMKKRMQPKSKKKVAQVQQNSGPQSTKISRFNGLKWIAVFVILVVSIAANYYYSDVSWAIRASVGILIVCVLLFIVYNTQKGQIAFGFIKSARGELRKVVWPNRKETVRTTFLVIGIVILTAIVLWGFDSFFIWGITHIMSVR